MIANGEHLPSIKVTWDHKTQAVDMVFDEQEFRSWEFIIATLGSAIEVAKTKRQITMMHNAQKAQMAAMAQEAQAQQLAGKVRGNILRG